MAFISTGLGSWIRGVGGDNSGAGTGLDAQILMVVSAPSSETPAAMT